MEKENVIIVNKLRNPKPINQLNALSHFIVLIFNLLYFAILLIFIKMIENKVGFIKK